MIECLTTSKYAYLVAGSKDAHSCIMLEEDHTVLNVSGRRTDDRRIPIRMGYFIHHTDGVFGRGSHNIYFLLE